MSYYREQLETYLAGLEIKADSVLDVGGASNPVSKRVKEWTVKEYRFLDNGAEEAKVDIDYDMDLNKSVWTANGATKFDKVFCLEVMEYIWNPLQALANLRDMIKDGGTMYITFPFVYPVHNPLEIDYMRYTPNGAVKLLEESGFALLDIVYRRDKSNSLETFYSVDGMRRSKQWPDGHNITGMIIEARAV